MRRIVPLLARLLSLLAAVALVAVGVVALVEVVTAWLGNDYSLVGDTVRELRTRAWSDPSVRIAIVALGATGLLCLLAALWPRPPLTVTTSDVDGMSIERSSLERALTHSLERVHGVRHARTRVKRGRVDATVATNRSSIDEVEEDARTRLQHELERQHLPLDPRLRIRAAKKTTR